MKLDEVTAYHGSNKKFDKFELKRISQKAFGFGFYFTSDLKTAKTYSYDMLYGKDLEALKKKIETDKKFKKYTDVCDSVIQYGYGKTLDWLKSELQRAKDSNETNKVKDKISFLKELFSEYKPLLYEIEISDISKFIDGNELLINQSDFVKKAIYPFISYWFINDDKYINDFMSSTTGTQYYDWLKERYEHSRGYGKGLQEGCYTSMLLLKLGIEGIFVKQPTNEIFYVVFNPKKIEIKSIKEI